MRRAARTDDNQKEIVDALRKAGWSVQSIASMGGGVPDLLIGRGGKNGQGGLNLLLEIKDGRKPPSKRMLTEDEREWHEKWNGNVRIVERLDDISDLLK